jgi:two-component system, LytTR family, response regulator
MSSPARLRVVIVDDEKPARELIATLLRSVPDVDIVAQCSDGSSAVTEIEKHEPDLVFLDVQMPDIDGFEVLASLRTTVRPLVVFVTAYDRHALQAFQVHAIDYILKPFEYDRLQQAVAHARTRLSERDRAESSDRLLRLLEAVKPPAEWDRIAVRDNGRVLFVRISDISRIEAEGNYVCVHSGREKHLHRETMADMEERLNAKRFVRVSRSALVNLEYVREWQPLFNGDSVVLMTSGEQVRVSRNYRDRLQRWIKE